MTLDEAFECKEKMATTVKDQATSVGIDVLDKIAAFFKIEPWQLLAKDLGAKLNESVNPAVTVQYHDPWPFDLAGLTQERYESLPLSSRHAIQTMMREAIGKEEAEVNRSKQLAAHSPPKAA